MKRPAIAGAVPNEPLWVRETLVRVVSETVLLVAEVAEVLIVLEMGWVACSEVAKTTSSVIEMLELEPLALVALMSVVGLYEVLEEVGMEVAFTITADAELELLLVPIVATLTTAEELAVWMATTATIVVEVPCAPAAL